MLKAERIDKLITAQALGDHDGWEQRMHAWHGLTPTDLTPCPRVAAGKRCRIYSRQYAQCLCQYDGITGILDHKRIWKDAQGRKVFTSEPYGGAHWIGYIEEYRQELADLGLTLAVSAQSPWYPLATVLLTARQS